MISYRKADWSDLEALLSLIEEGFSLQGATYSPEEGKKHRILFSYLYSQKRWDPKWLYLAEEKGVYMAMVGVFPQTLSFEEIDIPIWAISPVVTLPHFRGKGIAAECLNRALTDLKSKGIPASFLWGLPDYYPKLGFVPILPRYKTRLDPKGLIKKLSEITGDFRPFKIEDIEPVAALYNLDSQDLWMQPRRNLSWWRERFSEMNIEFAEIKEVPFPKKENFQVWENTQGGISGYLYFTEELEKKRIIINEAVAENFQTALEMVQTFTMEFLKPEQTLLIRGTPAHPLNAAAYRLGGTHLNPAPLAGMIKVLDWPKFLSDLIPLFASRLRSINFGPKELEYCLNIDGVSFEINLTDDVQPDLKVWLNNPAGDQNIGRLTRLVFGIYNPFDLQDLTIKEKKIVKILFPPRAPFIWDANYLY